MEDGSVEMETEGGRKEKWREEDEREREME